MFVKLSIILPLFHPACSRINPTHYLRFSFLCMFRPGNMSCLYYVCQPPARSFRSFLSAHDHIRVSFCIPFIQLSECRNKSRSAPCFLNYPYRDERSYFCYSKFHSDTICFRSVFFFFSVRYFIIAVILHNIIMQSFRVC